MIDIANLSTILDNDLTDLLDVPVSRSKSSPVPEVVAGFLQNDSTSYRL